VASALEEQPITAPATLLPSAAPAINTVTGNSIFSMLRARWAATDFENKVIISTVVGIVVFFAVALATISPSNNSTSYDEAVAKRGASTTPATASSSTSVPTTAASSVEAHRLMHGPLINAPLCSTR
jgi:hypothetical protein